MSMPNPELMRAIILATGFRGDAMHRAQGALLMIGLQGLDFDAGMLPAEVCGDDLHMAGMACASLRAQKLIVGIDRVKSSSPLANGRKVTLWRIPSDKVSTVRTLLARWGYTDTAPQQQEMALA